MKAEAVKARILLLSVCEKNRKGGHDGIGRARPADAGKTGIWRAMLDAVNHTLLPPSWFSYHLTAHTISVSMPAPSVQPSMLNFTISRLTLGLVFSPTILLSG